MSNTTPDPGTSVPLSKLSIFERDDNGMIKFVKINTTPDPIDDEITYGFDNGSPVEDYGFLTIKYHGLLYNFFGEEAKAITALIQQREAEARIDELETINTRDFNFHAITNDNNDLFDEIAGDYIEKRIAELTTNEQKGEK